MRIRNICDIVVTSGPERRTGMAGRVLANETRGVLAILTNGEKLSLRNEQFDYISELDINSSQEEEKCVKE